MAGEIKPVPIRDWTEEERVAARANCAERLRARGEDPLALSYELGDQDAGWAMRHEVARIRAEARAA